MSNLPKKLSQKLDARIQENALRKLTVAENLIDFSSNDYLGFAASESIFSEAENILSKRNLKKNGATGSRLISGNSTFYEEVETFIADFHKTEAALIFNSGYDANLGFFSIVPQRGDIVLYDEYSHASIRDGIMLGHANAFKFKHNDLDDLTKKLAQNYIKATKNKAEIYIVTESVFSMDGDSPDLKKLTIISKQFNARLIVDEAHAIGVFGRNGAGLVQDLSLENEIFAIIVTFGKAMGCHGAAVLGSNELKKFLVNFTRSFIYTTGLPPHSLATIMSAYLQLQSSELTGIFGENSKKLKENILHFQSEIHKKIKNSNPNIGIVYIESNAAIQCLIIPGNELVKSKSTNLELAGFNVKPILSPTVPKNEERLRFCMHSYNSLEEITAVLNLVFK
ncbi:pyridoxal phosphate-dependent aminotransferase family protein [Galbibacter sp. BG1]|uniref:aminotransferase class I/II-fold pyridoxal phosphate-dependent enzyme n=1 Tax=Galbibacter sp. BG1 TaxID=1170699 RepID=UPI0015BC6883|nr:pyridoxal phosphate-dependent aminotransferase family protein [Galbibacter sp. BG1]QLE00685.1 pyridoxal phosphate-dependent aminotransferase family protein [Galbibacter sp. BG1]